MRGMGILQTSHIPLKLIQCTYCISRSKQWIEKQRKQSNQSEENEINPACFKSANILRTTCLGRMKISPECLDLLQLSHIKIKILP